MAVTREQFESGMTYDQYKAQMTRNREQFEQNERDVVLAADDLRAFRGLPKPVRVMALAEDWCGDVVANLPIVGRIARDSGMVDLRIHLRDQAPGSTIMDQYLNRGQFRSIPTLIFLDDEFKDLAVWIERPESVTRLREQRRRELYAQHPEFGDPDKPIAELPEDVRVRVQQAIAEMRASLRPFATAEVIRELRQIVERIASQPAAPH
jgi:hypothetical protein